MTETRRELTHREILVVYAGLMMGMFVSALSQMIVSVALPSIVGDLGGLQYFSWVVTAMLLTTTVATPLIGKLSDLYGRKGLFQMSLAIFLVTSVLAGFSQNIGQLIAFRALQGIGAGGLMALSQAIIADVVPARQRGRYQGYMGSVWAVTMIIGPLIGGFLVDSLSWRWCFWVVIPVGVIGMGVIQKVLRFPYQRREHSIDYLGSSLLVVTVTSLLLVAVWGGSEYAWGSPVIVGLGAVSVAGVVMFVLQERRAAEPVLPLRLFANPVFNITSAVGFIVGLAMFGAMTFMPVYLQVATGASPTASGLLLLPLMAGMMVTMIGSGKLITSTGRYKAFPVAGTALLGLGLYLFSLMDTGTPRIVASVYMVVMGLGIGMVMQTLVIAVQNAVEFRDIGITTSAATFFRSLGGAMGTAMFGAVLNNRLAFHLPRLLGAEAEDVDVSALLGAPAQIQMLPPQARDAVMQGVALSLQTMFLLAVPLAVLAFALTLFLKELPLRETSFLTESQQEPTSRAEPNGHLSQQDAAGSPVRPEPRQ